MLRFYPGYNDKKNVYFPLERRAMVHNMVIGRYLSYHLKLDGTMKQNDAHYGFTPKKGAGDIWWVEGEDWRCTLPLPSLTVRSLMDLPATTYEDWAKRCAVFETHTRSHSPLRMALDLTCCARVCT